MDVVPEIVLVLMLLVPALVVVGTRYGLDRWPRGIIGAWEAPRQRMTLLWMHYGALVSLLAGVLYGWIAGWPLIASIVGLWCGCAYLIVRRDLLSSTTRPWWRPWVRRGTIGLPLLSIGGLTYWLLQYQVSEGVRLIIIAFWLVFVWGWCYSAIHPQYRDRSPHQGRWARWGTLGLPMLVVAIWALLSLIREGPTVWIPVLMGVPWMSSLFVLIYLICDGPLPVGAPSQRVLRFLTHGVLVLLPLVGLIGGLAAANWPPWILGGGGLYLVLIYLSLVSIYQLYRAHQRGTTTWRTWCLAISIPGLTVILPVALIVFLFIHDGPVQNDILILILGCGCLLGAHVVHHYLLQRTRRAAHLQPHQLARRRADWGWYGSLLLPLVVGLGVVFVMGWPLLMYQLAGVSGMVDNWVAWGGFLIGGLVVLSWIIDHLLMRRNGRTCVTWMLRGMEHGLVLVACALIGVSIVVQYVVHQELQDEGEFRCVLEDPDWRDGWWEADDVAIWEGMNEAVDGSAGAQEAVETFAALLEDNQTDPDDRVAQNNLACLLLAGYQPDGLGAAVSQGQQPSYEMVVSYTRNHSSTASPNDFSSLLNESNQRAYQEVSPAHVVSLASNDTIMNNGESTVCFIPSLPVEEHPITSRIICPTLSTIELHRSSRTLSDQQDIGIRVCGTRLVGVELLLVYSDRQDDSSSPQSQKVARSNVCADQLNRSEGVVFDNLGLDATPIGQRSYSAIVMLYLDKGKDEETAQKILNDYREKGECPTTAWVRCETLMP